MKQPPEERPPDREEKLPPLDEARRLLAQYIDDLRQIIAKLRDRPNWGASALVGRRLPACARSQAAQLSFFKLQLRAFRFNDMAIAFEHIEQYL
jgi:hypothetical protein